MNVLLPVDGSADALAAVRHLVALRRAGLAAEAVLVNVQEPPTLYEVVVAHDAERLSDLRRAAGADLLAPAEALLDAAGVPWQSEVAGGAPAPLLLELLENYGCTQVIMGSGAGRPGAVARAVLAAAAVPVTLVAAADGGGDDLPAGDDAGDPAPGPGDGDEAAGPGPA